MQTDCVSSTYFQGKVVILNTLSHKPYLNIKKAENNFTRQIKSKNYNLYIEQDYCLNKINIGVSMLQPRTMSGTIEHEELPVTAKSKRYIYAAKSAIDKFEKSQKEKEQQAWEQEQIKQKREEIAATLLNIVLAPVYIVEDAISGMLHEINPKWGKKFEKLLEKIGL